MGITGEQVWRVPSLTLLDPKAIINLESARKSEAVMLFNDRARLNNPEFELEAENVTEVAKICSKVDGIPLAVELVASRTRHMDPKMILERFADRFEKITSSDPRASKRQQTLQATIEWSYNLLSEREKLLFARLSVFSGGFGIAAAEDVCSDDRLPREIVLDTLSKLVDRSLVYTTKTVDQSMRYNCLETLRQFGHQLIKEQNREEPFRKRHLQFFLAMAEQAYRDQYDSEFKWMNKFELEHDNLITALDWSYTQSIEEYIMLSGYLAWFWRNKSHLQVAVDYLEKALSRDTGNSEAYARTLYGLGMIVFYSGDTPRSIKLLNDSLNIWRKLKNSWEEAVVLGWLGSVISSTDPQTALKYREQSLKIARRVGDPGLINHCLLFVCQQYAHTQQYDRGMPLVEELYTSSLKHEYPLGIYASIHFKADLVLGIKKFKEAEKQYAFALETGLNYGLILYAVMDMQAVAFALSGQSRWAKSIRLDAAAREKMKALGLNIDGLYKFWDDWIDTYIEGAKKEVGEELATQYEQEGIALGFDKAVEYALDFDKD
jgi:non-specific serine/threonine protein kinase